MVRKLFIYTGIVIWHFEKAKKKTNKQNKNKKPEISIFVTIFVEKCYFGLYFTAEMEFSKELITTLKMLVITIL